MAEPKNPYAAPAAHVADVAGSTDDGQLIDGGQTVPAGNGWQWIVDGFDLFKMNPGIWIVNLIILVVIMFVLAFIPVIGALGTYILLPILSGGLMLGCQALMHNEPLEVGHLFAGFREKAGPLAMLGLLYLVGLILIMLIASLFVGFGLFGALFSGGRPAMSVTMILLAALIVLGLSIPLAMAIWFAPALVVFHDLPPMDALKQSFTGLPEEHRALPGLRHPGTGDRDHCDHSVRAGMAGLGPDVDRLDLYRLSRHLPRARVSSSSALARTAWAVRPDFYSLWTCSTRRATSPRPKASS